MGQGRLFLFLPPDPKEFKESAQEPYQFSGRGSMGGCRDQSFGVNKSFGIDGNRQEVSSWNFSSMLSETGSKERSQKVQTCDKSETSKSIDWFKISEIRRYISGASNAEERGLDVFSRHGSRIPSCADKCEMSSFDGNLVEGKVVSFQSPSFWSIPFSMGFLYNNRSVYSTSSHQDDESFSLHRRFSDDGKDKGIMLGKEIVGGVTCSGSWNTLFSNKGPERTNSILGTFGIDNKYSSGNSADSRREDHCIAGIDCGSSYFEENNRKDTSKDSWKSDQHCESFQSCKAFYKGSLFLSEGVSKEAECLGLGPGDGVERYGMFSTRLVTPSSEEVQWKDCMEESFIGTNLYRCFNQGMGNLHGRSAIWRSLDRRGIQEAYQRVGAAGSEERSAKSKKSHSRESYSTSCGQYDSLYLPVEFQGRKSTFSEQCGNGYLESGGTDGCRLGRSSMDSIRREQSRLGISLHGDSALGSVGSCVPEGFWKVGSSNSGSFCKSQKCKMCSFQFREMVPRNSWSQCFGTKGLVQSSQLGGPPNKVDLENFASNRGAKGKGNHSASMLDQQTMVDVSAGDHSGLFHSSKFFLEMGKEDSRGTFIPKGLELDDSSYRWRKIQHLVKAGRASSTIVQYEKIWRKFKVWMDTNGMNKSTISADDIIDYILECREQGIEMDWNLLLPALKLELLDQRSNILKDEVLLEVVKGARRLYAQNMTEMDPRLPLPSSAIEFYCKSGNESAHWLWIRNKAILTLGFRLMRRPGELGWLKKKHVRFEGNHMNVKIPKSKTDQEQKGRWIVVDRTFGAACPVRCMEEWLELSAEDGREELFYGAHGGKLTAAAVGQLVKKVAELASLTGRFTGHSLRIGGATAALKGGLSIDQIRSVGDWKSDAVLLYLRSVAVAELGASKCMGL